MRMCVCFSCRYIIYFFLLFVYCLTFTHKKAIIEQNDLYQMFHIIRLYGSVGLVEEFTTAIGGKIFSVCDVSFNATDCVSLK